MHQSLRYLKHVSVFWLGITGTFSPAIAAVASNEPDNFHFTITNLPAHVKKLMTLYTWHPGCPVGFNNLAYLRVTYWGFDNKIHTGRMIVNKKIALEAANIFHELYLQKFPIERMEPMYSFKGNYNAALMANNTYSFDCRPDPFDPDKFSMHSYGYAIDVNALINPRVSDHTVQPASGVAYLDRSQAVPGMIKLSDPAYYTFVHHSWAWGGEGKSTKNFRHFQKNY